MFLIQVLFVLFLNTLVTSQNLEVTTPSGKILGSTLRTRLGKTIFSFRGIRYAEPPVGELRFKPPVPIEKWSGIYHATTDGPRCPQPSREPVSEDCLILNVYTTKLPENGCNPKRPVIVYLHAGGFYSGTSRSNRAGPHYFLDQNIVLVTFNYRLGSLGFISLGKDAPGNNGLKDQVVALKWIKSNIAAFGGDPDSVTLFGYSAGSRSVTLHLISPMSRGLFHKVIIGSGSALGHLPTPKNQIELAKKQARILGCSDNVDEILECLKTKPAEEFGNSLSQFAEFGSDPVLIWQPVIEDDYGQERFLPEHPLKLIQEGNFEKVPVVIGMTKDGFANLAFRLVANATLLQMMSDHFENYAPISFLYERGTAKSKKVSAAVRKFYFEDGPLTNASLSGLTKVYPDSITGFPLNRAVHLIAEKNPKPVFYYKFSYQGRYSHFYLPGTQKPYGVVHHDDLIYLFYISRQFPFFNSTDPEAEMVDKLTSLWANFASTGKPFLRSHDDVEWEPYNLATKKYLDIGKKLVLKDNMFKEKYDFWWRLYPLSC